ncbi:MAG: DUF3293 domain-containing protein [Bacteroidota bacterium]
MDHLIAAYLETDYWVNVDVNTKICIHIDQFHPRLDQLLVKHRATHWAYLTAWNPYSKPLSFTENQALNTKLITQFAGKTYFLGKGVSQKGNWWEASFLVLDIAVVTAKLLGQEFQQKAILVGQRGKKAQLCFC